MDQRSGDGHSVDDLKYPRPIKRIPGLDFDLLDARIAPALNKIIQTHRFKKKISVEEIGFGDLEI